MNFFCIVMIYNHFCGIIFKEYNLKLKRNTNYKEKLKQYYLKNKEDNICNSHFPAIYYKALITSSLIIFSY